ncbi:MAG: hypothetical protein R2706_09705 [Acidimicrobiales bacterium]
MARLEPAEELVQSRAFVLLTALAVAASIVTSVQSAVAADLHLSGAWSPTTTTAGDVTITVSGPGLVADTMGAVNAYSNPAVPGNGSASILFPTTASSVTFTFSRPVSNPILHLDRLGGYGGTATNGVRLSLASGLPSRS